MLFFCNPSNISATLKLQGPRGPLGTSSSRHSSIRLFVLPSARQIYIDHLYTYKLSQDHVWPLIWHIVGKRKMSAIMWLQSYHYVCISKTGNLPLTKRDPGINRTGTEYMKSSSIKKLHLSYHTIFIMREKKQSVPQFQNAGYPMTFR